MDFFKRHFLFFTVIPLLLLFVVTSYYRFLVAEDFLVSYEGDCDPETHSCFVGCDDDACEETYLYSEIERHAKQIKDMCGEDITDCDEAFYCEEPDPTCTVTFCDETDFEADCSSKFNESI